MPYEDLREEQKRLFHSVNACAWDWISEQVALAGLDNAAHTSTARFYDALAQKEYKA